VLLIGFSRLAWSERQSAAGRGAQVQLGWTGLPDLLALLDLAHLAHLLGSLLDLCGT
jgi:hypothetical protein